jgi:hypothetical protein
LTLLGCVENGPYALAEPIHLMTREIKQSSGKIEAPFNSSGEVHPQEVWIV